ncbi:MAG: cytochrome c5 family protein [Nitrosomonadales bacterium]|nr:cytochrome c5 family protein [Nitrosomonadales bacterium]
MQKQILIATALFALLSGYGSMNKAFAAPASAVAETHNAAAAPVPPVSPKPQPNETKPQASAPDLVTGEKIYKKTCTACHKFGASGAPRMGSKPDWEPRLAQGNEILYDHAVNGFKGKKGIMPARGSNVKLSVSEVKAAVDYIIANALSN